MDLAQAIAVFIQTDGISASILVFLGWFLTVKLWPWLTKEYWPELVKRQAASTATLKLLSDNLIELKNDFRHISQLVDRNYTAARGRDELVLESLAALHARLKYVPLANGAEVAKEIHDILKEGE